MHVFGFSARPPTRFRCARREVVDTERADACDVGVAMSRARKSMRVVDGDAHSRRVRRAKIRKISSSPVAPNVRCLRIGRITERYVHIVKIVIFLKSQEYVYLSMI